ncbi:MAG: UDP-N-acetylmuramate--L-alanine ligase [Pseudomonadota bacterium]
MNVLPLQVGTLHFIGIGGIGMSGIAEILHNLGYQVQGSDLAAGANVKRLQAMGVSVRVGHDASNLGDAKVVIVSSAVQESNPELIEARARRLPVVRRAEMLGELMRLKWSVAVAGTHGKTTTTSMVAALFDAAGMDPTVVNGGIINAYGTNARLGAGEWMVVEADESDGSLVRLPATIAIVTNIDPEHLDHYGSFESLKATFFQFLERVPFYGVCVLCLDHPEVQSLMGRVTDRRVLSYGFNPQADVRAIDLRLDPSGTTFDVVIRNGGAPLQLAGLRLAMPGRHNVQNALAAIAVAYRLQLSEGVIRRALGEFAGVKRRFTVTGAAGGVTVVDDYGHHPVEIEAVLATARQVTAGKVVAVVQPHRYTRLRDLFDDFCTAFNGAETVFVAPVHAAGEAPIPGIDHEALAEGLRDHGHRDARSIDGPESLAAELSKVTGAGDLVVCLGAGTITQWAHALPGELQRLDGAER